MTTRKSSNKYFIQIIALIVIVFALTIIANKSYAYGTWKGTATEGMPSRVLSETGLLPQILKQRVFTGNADIQFPYTSWTTNISAGTVFCANNGTAVRFGVYDENRYFVDCAQEFDDDTSYSYENFEKMMEDNLLAKAKEGASEHNGEFVKLTTDYNISYEQFDGPDDPDDSSRYDIEPDKALIPLSLNEEYGNWIDRVSYVTQEVAPRMITAIFDKLGEWEQPIDTEDDSTNPDEQQLPWDGHPIYGPTICVMETSDRAGDGYKAVSINQEQSNNRFAFILSTLENSYNTSIHTRYTLGDIQTAFWKEVDHDGIRNTAKLTANGLNLFQKAVDYQNFVDTELSKFASSDDAVKIDVQQAQVIVNQETKEYTVGPISIDYPYYEDISYLKSIYVETDTGAIMIYDENTTNFQIKCIGQEVSGSNGLTRVYPAPGTSFYIKFSANSGNYPKEIKIYADCEYLDTTHIVYNELRSKGNIYQYYGYCDNSGKFAMRKAWGKGSVGYQYKKWEYDHYAPPQYDSQGNLISEGQDVYDWHYYTDIATVNGRSRWSNDITTICANEC